VGRKGFGATNGCKERLLKSEEKSSLFASIGSHGFWLLSGWTFTNDEKEEVQMMTNREDAVTIIRVADALRAMYATPSWRSRPISELPESLRNAAGQVDLSNADLAAIIDAERTATHQELNEGCGVLRCVLDRASLSAQRARPDQTGG
jgi:hypothetical protein